MILIYLVLYEILFWCSFILWEVFCFLMMMNLVEMGFVWVSDLFSFIIFLLKLLKVLNICCFLVRVVFNLWWWFISLIVILLIVDFVCLMFEWILWMILGFLLFLLMIYFLVFFMVLIFCLWMMILFLRFLKEKK